MAQAPVLVVQVLVAPVVKVPVVKVLVVLAPGTVPAALLARRPGVALAARRHHRRPVLKAREAARPAAIPLGAPAIGLGAATAMPGSRAAGTSAAGAAPGRKVAGYSVAAAGSGWNPPGARA
jgi:hypothetical protein